MDGDAHLDRALRSLFDDAATQAAGATGGEGSTPVGAAIAAPENARFDGLCWGCRLGVCGVFVPTTDDSYQHVDSKKVTAEYFISSRGKAGR